MDRVATLYIREVPEDVVQALKERAALEGTSLSSYVAAQLTRWATRPTDQQMVERLRSLDPTSGPSSQDIVSAIRQGRP
ncbi:FitA-like ribbon-helix-helix domain-containing protein [Aestuariimicrobium sp. Y1814]|uniref:FitA-like ribbon-helix-helix domain-containing protein n=1 Tax=Aestuariimicrobium sp. Y1814 TaxID=3418742 RepID=UPI003DA77C3D